MEIVSSGCALPRPSSASARNVHATVLRFAACMAFASLAGCASVPTSGSLLAGMGARGQAKTIAQLDLKAATVLPLGQEGLDAAFDGSSDVLHLTGYDSYYRIFRIDPSEGQRKVVVRAYCRCLGFDKRMMVPVLRFLDDRGLPVEAIDTRYSLVQAESFTPMSLKLRVFVPAGNVRYVVVVADNSQPDSTVQGINVDGVLHLDIRSYPLGKFNVTYQAL